MTREDLIEVVKGAKKTINDLKGIRINVRRNIDFNAAIMYGLIFGLFGGFVANIFYNELFSKAPAIAQFIIVIVSLIIIAIFLLIGIREHTKWTNGIKEIDSHIRLQENFIQEWYNLKNKK